MLTLVFASEQIYVVDARACFENIGSAEFLSAHRPIRSAGNCLRPEAPRIDINKNCHGYSIRICYLTLCGVAI